MGLDSASETLNFDGKGVSLTGIGSFDLDLKVTDLSYFTGLQLIVSGNSMEDNCTLQVIDKDNVLGFGSNVVLKQFAVNWMLQTDKQDQGLFNVDYPAKILPGIYIRVKFNSSQNNSVTLKVNFFLHKILA